MLDCLFGKADPANDPGYFGHKECGDPQLCSNGIAARLRRLVFIHDRNIDRPWHHGTVDTHRQSLMGREHVVGRIRL